MFCRVLHCRNSTARADPLASWYSFPKNPNLRAAWESACANPKLDLSSEINALCGEHFSDSDFGGTVHSSTGIAIRRLKFGSLPTLKLPDNAYLDFPKEKPPRKTIIDRSAPSPSTGAEGVSQQLKRKSDGQPGHSTGQAKVQKVEVRIKSKVEMEQLEEIKRLKAELASAKETENVLRRQVNQFYKVFTKGQLRTLFSFGAANLAKKFFKSTLVEEAVEQRTSGSSHQGPPTDRDDHNYVPEQENSVQDENDDAAFERCMSNYKGVLTRLKTN